jgi:peptide methionine sulfoxide reductase MsrB
MFLTKSSATAVLGAELRCGTCGGHLGDVFLDGKVFPNTPAFVTGKRHCIDGGALVFKPADGSDDLAGDVPAASARKS